MRTHLVFVLVTSLVTACVSSSVQAGSPAVMINPTAASHAELVTIIGTALGNSPVILADDALVTDSVLIIERRPRRDSSGQWLDGREKQLPERFLLTLNGKRCVLIHERTQQKITLEHTQCQLKR